MTLKIPEIAVPNFWLSNFGRVQNYLVHSVGLGNVHEVGTSSLGYPIKAVEYRQEGCPKLMVIGGTHGHEPGTVATAINVIHLLESGIDLAGQPHSDLLERLLGVHLYIVPCLNPDGRSVCPDTFYAQGIDTVTIYASGLQKDGSLIPYDSNSKEPLYYFDPADAMFMGGQFNGAGYAINRRRSIEESDAVEVQSLLDFVKPLGIDAIMDLHACGYNFAFQVKSHEPPYWPIMREWQRRATALFQSKGRRLGGLHGDGDPPEPQPFHFNAALFHRQAQLMWMSYEGRQGYLGRTSFIPLPSEWEIIDDYLSAVSVFLELGIERHYAEANRQVFSS